MSNPDEALGLVTDPDLSERDAMSNTSITIRYSTYAAKPIGGRSHSTIGVPRVELSIQGELQQVTEADFLADVRSTMAGSKVSRGNHRHGTVLDREANEAIWYRLKEVGYTGGTARVVRVERPGLMSRSATKRAWDEFQQSGRRVFDVQTEDGKAPKWWD